jgi:hypothetical protein
VNAATSNSLPCNKLGVNWRLLKFRVVLILPVVNLGRLTIGISNSEGVHVRATGLSRLATNRDNKIQDPSIIV